MGRKKKDVVPVEALAKEFYLLDTSGDNETRKQNIYNRIKDKCNETVHRYGGEWSDTFDGFLYQTIIEYKNNWEYEFIDFFTQSAIRNSLLPEKPPRKVKSPSGGARKTVMVNKVVRVKREYILDRKNILKLNTERMERSAEVMDVIGDMKLIGVGITQYKTNSLATLVLTFSDEKDNMRDVVIEVDGKAPVYVSEKY